MAQAVEPTAAPETEPAAAPETGPAAAPEAEPAAAPETGAAAAPEADPAAAPEADPAGTPSPDIAIGAAEAAGAPTGPAAPTAEEEALLDEELPPWLAPPVEQFGASPAPPAGPARVIAQVGGGMSLRIVRNHDYQQQAFAPAYLDLMGGYLFGARGRLLHGAGLGISTNLSGDGTFDHGIDPFGQIVLSPTYLLQLRFSDDPVADISALLKVGVPFVLPAFGFGLEVAGSLTYMLLAGLGVYGELGLMATTGGLGRSYAQTIHPILSAELGFQIDLELL